MPFANLHAMRFAAHITEAELRKRSIDPAIIDFFTMVSPGF
jgi:hypothetical protein